MNENELWVEILGVGPSIAVPRGGGEVYLNKWFRILQMINW